MPCVPCAGVALHDDTPTCKTTGVFIGLVELKGTAESEQPLVAYLSGIRCVHHAWSVEEHWVAHGHRDLQRLQRPDAYADSA